jgi:hypothetical protein
MWDRAEPVRRGLGHVMIQADPDAGSRAPDLCFWTLGERGASDSRLAAVCFAFATNPSAVAADSALLARLRDKPGYPRAVAVVIGRRAELDAVPATDGVATILFDTEKWQVVPGGAATRGFNPWNAISEFPCPASHSRSPPSSGSHS